MPFSSDEQDKDSRDGFEKAADFLTDQFSQLKKLKAVSGSVDTMKFFSTIKRDDDATLRQMLAAGFDPNAYNAQGQTGLHLAAIKNAAKAAAALIEYGADPLAGMKDNPDHKPMEDAIRFNGVKAAGILMKADGYPFDARVDEKTLLHYACAKNRADLVMTLIENGMDPNAQTENGATPLIIALVREHRNLVDVLLEIPAVVQNIEKHIVCTDEKRRTVFALAIDFQQTEAVQKMINSGANVNAVGQDGMTPLMRAIDAKDLKLIHMLVSAGADINKFDDEKRSPLHYIFWFSTELSDDERIDLGFKLVDYGADVDTALLLVSLHGFGGCIDRLLDMSANVNARDPKTGRTPLIEAVRSGNVDIVEALLLADADWLITDNTGNTARDYAINYQYQVICRLLPEDNKTAALSSGTGFGPAASAASSIDEKKTNASFVQITNRKDKKPPSKDR